MSRPQAIAALTSLEAEMVHLFAELAMALGLPRSVGEILGFIFAEPEPVRFEQVVERLGISKGSASQGLRLLQKVGAVHVREVPNDRRTYYEPETSLRQLVGGMLEETLRPHLEQGNAHLDRIEELAEDEPNLSPAIEYRVKLLRNWHRRANQVLPWVARFAAAGKKARDHQPEGAR